MPYLWYNLINQTRSKDTMKDNEKIDVDYRNTSIENLLEDMKYDISDRTFDEYSNAVKSFFFDFIKIDSITIKDIEEVTVKDGNEWIYQMKKDGLGNSTINKKAGGLLWFYKHLISSNEYDISMNPFSTDLGSNRLKLKRYSDGIRISDDKLKELNNYFLKRRDWIGERNYLMFLIFVTTGMRHSEVLHIKIGDFFDYGDKFAVKFTGKGDKLNISEIPQGVKQILHSFIIRSDWDYTMREQSLFVAKPESNVPITKMRTTDIFKEAYRRVGLPEETRIHDLRHTYITKSIEMGLDIYDISKRVGHSSVDTTRRYDHTFRIFNNNPAEDFFSQLSGSSQENYPALKLIKGVM
ncbi:tyrosine-type recombinase/integrase [Peptoniphilus sp. MSJ-1]|uniref:Tyrosine-type recombinase/integrase n=1 Tax=Peptoniphilus ovalis TaxID=2841503 RepID=A0ABS6FHJ1_9FIRM|nr:site-specific integrase [Peptoniphilus ovalis]MBU5669642.1 tyrosine-type recombinase/integrase [Peptoniphilus ovalis]